jgi:hypothetical protein
MAAGWNRQFRKLIKISFCIKKYFNSNLSWISSIYSSGSNERFSMEMKREQINFAIQSLMAYATIALKNNQLTKNLAEHIRKQCLSLLEQIKMGKMEGNKGVENFSQRNNHMKYPFCEIRTSASHVKNEVIAFEHFVTQELISKKVPLKDEKEIFNEALFLWRDVGNTLSPRQGMSKLSHLIKRMNGMLPKDEHYPFPDESQYTDS